MSGRLFENDSGGGWQVGSTTAGLEEYSCVWSFLVTSKCLDFERDAHNHTIQNPNVDGGLSVFTAIRIGLDFRINRNNRTTPNTSENWELLIYFPAKTVRTLEKVDGLSIILRISKSKKEGKVLGFVEIVVGSVLSRVMEECNNIKQKLHKMRIWKFDELKGGRVADDDMTQSGDGVGRLRVDMRTWTTAKVGEEFDNTTNEVDG